MERSAKGKMKGWLGTGEDPAGMSKKMQGFLRNWRIGTTSSWGVMCPVNWREEAVWKSLKDLRWQEGFRVGKWEYGKQWARVGLDMQLKKRFVPRSGTAAKRVGKRKWWGVIGTWVEMGINSPGEALKPMGKYSGVSHWLRGGDAASCKETCCYF